MSPTLAAPGPDTANLQMLSAGDDNDDDDDDDGARSMHAQNQPTAMATSVADTSRPARGTAAAAPQRRTVTYGNVNEQCKAMIDLAQKRQMLPEALAVIKWICTRIAAGKRPFHDIVARLHTDHAEIDAAAVFTSHSIGLHGNISDLPAPTPSLAVGAPHTLRIGNLSGKPEPRSKRKKDDIATAAPAPKYATLDASSNANGNAAPTSTPIPREQRPETCGYCGDRQHRVVTCTPLKLHGTRIDADRLAKLKESYTLAFSSVGAAPVFIQRVVSSDSTALADFNSPIDKQIGHFVIQGIFFLPVNDGVMSTTGRCYRVSGLHSQHRVPPYVQGFDSVWKSEEMVAQWVERHFRAKRPSKSHYLLEGLKIKELAHAMGPAAASTE